MVRLKTFIRVSLTAVFLVLLLSACGGKGAGNDSIQAEAGHSNNDTPLSSNTSVYSDNIIESTEPTDIIEDIIRKCENTPNSGYQDYRIERGENANYLYLLFCDDGWSYAFLTDSEKWQVLTNSVDSLCAACRSRFADAGYDSWHVKIYILNDKNQQKALYSTIDGVVSESPAIKEPTPSPLTLEDYIVYEPLTDTTVDVWNDTLQEYDYTYVFWNPVKEPDKTTSFVTKRGIRPGDTIEKVLNTYGQADINSFDITHSEVYYDLKTNRPTAAEIMETYCKSYVRYVVPNGGSIQFLFDDNREVSWVIYYFFQ